MDTSQILTKLNDLLKESAKAFPDDLHFSVKCYFEDAEGTKYLAYPDLKKPLEAWGELTVYSGDEPDEEEDGSETTYTFPAMIAVKANGEIDESELEEVRAGMKEEIGTFMEGVNSSESFEAFLRSKNAAAEQAYREQLEKYERSLKQMKRIVYGCTAVAVVVVVLLIIVKALAK